MLPNETIRAGARPTCDCGATLPLKVCCSGAGHYIGTWCDACGPYSRESHYYQRAEDAERALATNTVRWRT